MTTFNWLLVGALAVLGAWGLVRAILRIRREERERLRWVSDRVRASSLAATQMADAYRAAEEATPASSWRVCPSCREHKCWSNDRRLCLACSFQVRT